MREWLVAADDRTGAFEVAALFAHVTALATVTVGDAPAGSGVVDLGSREMSAAEAARMAAGVDASASAWVAHKIDSTLRGNWVVELLARQQATGRRIVVLPGWPELGRTCIGGVVHVDGAPIGNVLDHLPNADLLSGAAELSGWLDGFGPIAVCDVTDTPAMHAATLALAGHDVLLAGPAGPIGAAFSMRGGYEFPEQPHWFPTGAEPVLILCGSANPVAREQIERLRRARPEIEVVAIAAANGELSRAALVPFAAKARARIDEVDPRTIVIIGGDTAAAILGDGSQVVNGFAAVGMPCGRDAEGRLIITKAGGFGGPDALVDLLRDENG